ncbi:MAG: 50S ribosomal protein L18 [Chloroflexi bacterium]|nr:50S ribosomal protein L18 [Chloroflexota bacterium]HEV8054629.1 50S ribosomal protein L18 [Candidatus Limnocylindrales bacterium]
MNITTRGEARRKRHVRIRLNVSGTGDRPRLAVYRSLKQIYAQVIDDSSGRTLASASSLEASLRGRDGSKSDRARAVGSLLGERARAAGVDSVVFDRAGFRFHGRVKSLAEGAREAGLQF